jgi:hypothetical protein
LVLGQLLERMEWMESEPDFPSFPFSCIAFILCGELALLRFRVRAPFWSCGPRGRECRLSDGGIPYNPSPYNKEANNRPTQSEQV